MLALPADALCEIATHAVEGDLSAATLARAAPRLRTFLPRALFVRLWRLGGATIPPARVRHALADIRAQSRRALRRARAADGPLGPREHLAVVLSQEDRTHVLVHIQHKGESAEPVPIDVGLLRPGPARLSAHRCMLKRDAFDQYGTYAPYDGQDFLPARRGTYVTELSTHAYCASTTL